LWGSQSWLPPPFRRRSRCSQLPVSFAASPARSAALYSNFFLNCSN
jgi:hypothetical protein